VAARVDPATVARLAAEIKRPDPAEEISVAPDGGAAEAAAAAAPGLARRLWPNLKLVLANGTGAFAPHARRLRAGAGADVPLLSTILAASEGLIGVGLAPGDDGDSAYCLVPRAMVFEFLDADGGGGGGALLAADVVVGKDYELVVTTLGGLCRYRLGDVVTVVGRHGAAPLVKFAYRAGQVLNARGEKTSEAALSVGINHGERRPAWDIFKPLSLAQIELVFHDS
jgi:hypothetical protein